VPFNSFCVPTAPLFVVNAVSSGNPLHYVETGLAPSPESTTVAKKDSPQAVPCYEYSPLRPQLSEHGLQSKTRLEHCILKGVGVCYRSIRKSHRGWRDRKPLIHKR